MPSRRIHLAATYSLELNVNHTNSQWYKYWGVITHTPVHMEKAEWNRQQTNLLHKTGVPNWFMPEMHDPIKARHCTQNHTCRTKQTCIAFGTREYQAYPKIQAFLHSKGHFRSLFENNHTQPLIHRPFQRCGLHPFWPKNRGRKGHPKTEWDSPWRLNWANHCQICQQPK